MNKEMDLITARELTKRLKITMPTLYNWRKKGLPTIFLGPGTWPRYDYNAVKNWFELQNKQDHEVGES